MNEPRATRRYKVTRTWYVDAVDGPAAVRAAAPKREKIVRVDVVFPEEEALMDTLDSAEHEYLMRGPEQVLVHRPRGRRVGS